MSLAIGSQLGSYEIRALLGKGGMGEVYRARDAKLKRDVAIKILPDEFAGDPERVSRFQREAEMLAALNHSNIAGIHELALAGSARFLVLELVEGETLAQRIARGALPIEESLDIARQIAEALEAAHDRGVVHRDLKPANIKIAPDGKVKVLDFGLAKMRESAFLDTAGLSNSPTVVSGTMPGVIMGTAAYMSPEQARGKPVDRSADVWAFATVLYEMLTGRQTFDGETVTDILGAIVKSEPDWSRLPKDVPPHVRRLLKRCLEKDRRRRLRDASAVLLDLHDSPEAEMVPKSPHARWGWIAASVLAMALVVSLVFALRPIPAAPEMRLDINTPATTDPASMAISPDGQQIVFVATSDGQQRLWVRSLDSVVDRALAGTEGASYPFWSPDSRSIAFFADGRLKRIDVFGGTAQTLASSLAARGGTWNGEGVILFTGSASGPILSVPTSGGQPSTVTRVQSPEQSSHRFARFLPDGRHFLFYSQGTLAARGVYVGSLDGPETQRLFDADAAAEYVAPGYLLFARQGTLLGQRFDSARLKLDGDPFPVTDQVIVDGASIAAVSSSRTGLVAYRSGGAGAQQQLVWLDRSGKAIGTVGSPDSSSPQDVELSPDGKRVTLQRVLNGNTDIWLVEVARGVMNRLTVDAAVDAQPIWSADGSAIIFTSNRRGAFDLYRKSIGGGGNEELLIESTFAKIPQHVSPDGRFLLYCNIDSKTGYDLWALPLMSGANASPTGRSNQGLSGANASLTERNDQVNGDRKPFSVVQTSFEERDGQFSPDGKWIAYRSNESGRFEVYVQPFPGPGHETQVSTNGGSQPRWRADGKELFYIGLDSRIMAAPMQFSAKGQIVEPGTPVALFPSRITGGPLSAVYRHQYAASSDGQRFLLNIMQESATSPITLILNWHPERVK
jgi:eukaryotic-like serine/threonine-protein kinase